MAVVRPLSAGSLTSAALSAPTPKSGFAADLLWVQQNEILEQAVMVIETAGAHRV